jgi:hypothetical protein
MLCWVSGFEAGSGTVVAGNASVKVQNFVIKNLVETLILKFFEWGPHKSASVERRKC